MTEAEFEVSVPADAATQFAELSGDWNPLHTDPAYAANTQYGRTVLHGAYMTGLVSRMAGMYLPGTECLLHSIRIRFLAPVLPPVTVRVTGKIRSDNGQSGSVEVNISDADTSAAYASASYEFGRHVTREVVEPTPTAGTSQPTAAARVLVTGATGALGAAVVSELGASGVGVTRGASEGLLTVPDIEHIGQIETGPISAIVHCGWPRPDNRPLLDPEDPIAGVEHHIASPIRQALALARLLAERGTEDAMLVLVGSTAADPGRHNYRMPLYTLGKSLIPAMTRILALELAPSGRRCVALTFDVLDGGMNEGASARARIMNQDRSPFGLIPTPQQAARQIMWALDNENFLSSGATIELTGGVIP